MRLRVGWNRGERVGGARQSGWLHPDNCGSQAKDYESDAVPGLSLSQVRVASHANSRT
ncbi:hypothetical protein IQ268_03295 [Oculatella sp. LEGE 06141]|nr:hypothetical protein [Oculatella sp. LEGE 06141]